jgi:inosose dehydratase
VTSLTRREWLCGTAALLPFAFARAEEKPAPIRLGFSLYGMKTLELNEAIKTCGNLGYDGVELVMMPGWPTEPKKLTAADRKDLRGRLADAKLTLHGLMENLPEPATDEVHKTNLDRLKAAAELGHDLSPSAPPPIETILGGKPADWEKIKDRMAERLRAWAEVARDAKTIIAIKPHVNNTLRTPEAALWLHKQVNSPWIKLAYDFSHYAVQKMSLAKTAEAILPETAFVHIKDVKGTTEKFEFLLPGTEGTDYVEYAKVLRKAKYAGPVVVEVSALVFNKPGYDPVAAAKQCYAKLAPAFNK